MHRSLRLVGWVSYALFVGSAAAALLIVLTMIWTPTSSPGRPDHWRALGTALCVLAFALLLMVGTKALRDAVGLPAERRTDGGVLAR